MRKISWLWSDFDMIIPWIESSDILFWHENNFESNFWKFCGKQTKWISPVEIESVYTPVKFQSIKSTKCSKNAVYMGGNQSTHFPWFGRRFWSSFLTHFSSMFLIKEAVSQPLTVGMPARKRTASGPLMDPASKKTPSPPPHGPQGAKKAASRAPHGLQRANVFFCFHFGFGRYAISEQNKKISQKEEFLISRNRFQFRLQFSHIVQKFILTRFLLLLEEKL